MKIYDCFTFYNELDLLEIRFEELYDHVDHFVIVEANRTFQNNSKPFYFMENLKRFEPYLNKVIHYTVADMPEDTDAWGREKYQRDAIARAVVDADDNDIIIVSDCDEVLRGEAIAQMRSSTHMAFALRMPLFNFKFNYMRIAPGQYDVWAMAARKSVLRHISPDQLRNSRFQYSDWPLNYQTGEIKIIEHSGWHFGYLGDIEYLKDKARSFSHAEVNRPEFFEQLDIETSIQERKEWDRTQTARYEIVKLTEYFPKSILAKQEQYSHFILDGEHLPLDFLPH